MNKWTFNDIPEQQGRIALVTGANSGLGFQTSLMLAKKGAKVLLACRDLNKASNAADSILKEFPEAKVNPIKLDLADLNSVSECAAKVKEEYEHLDLLINNAGVMVPPFSQTQQGFELQFGTNHLGHFALTGELLPLLLRTPESRIVPLASVAATLNYIDFKDLNCDQKRYKKWLAYGQSKLANMMFHIELAERLEENHAKTIAVAAHPGVASTNLFRTIGVWGKLASALIAHSPAQGALSTLRAACDPEAKNGTYWGPSGFLSFKGNPVPAKFTKMAQDPKLRKELWEKSEKLTGVKYDFKVI